MKVKVFYPDRDGNIRFSKKELEALLDEVYNEGYYESLVISIGDAEGDNWWCVLFPNFCLIDIDKSYEYKSYFKELFTKYSKN